MFFERKAFVYGQQFHPDCCHYGLFSSITYLKKASHDGRAGTHDAARSPHSCYTGAGCRARTGAGLRTCPVHGPCCLSPSEFAALTRSERFSPNSIFVGPAGALLHSDWYFLCREPFRSSRRSWFKPLLAAEMIEQQSMAKFTWSWDDSFSFVNKASTILTAGTLALAIVPCMALSLRSRARANLGMADMTSSFKSTFWQDKLLGHGYFS